MRILGCFEVFLGKLFCCGALGRVVVRKGRAVEVSSKASVELS